MPADKTAPAWANEIARAYESGAHGQFVLSGNVADRLVSRDGKRLEPLISWMTQALLPRFAVIFTYDLGNGLRLERGGDLAERFSLVDSAKLPRPARPAFELVTAYLRYLHNLRSIGQTDVPHVALIVRGADQVMPAAGGGHDHGGLVSLVRDWSDQAPFVGLPFVSILIADNLADLSPLLARNPHAVRIPVPLPDAAMLERALAVLQVEAPQAFAADADRDRLAASLVGASLSAVESALRRAHHAATPLDDRAVIALKKALIEGDAGTLIEFITSTKTLDAYHGQAALKTWLRQDAELWRKGDLAAMPMGYLVCGPVGTGKTYLVECLAGEYGVPVVKLKNFRDKWVGSSESNLETIFRLIHALGRCIVFVDEADQALGRRDASANDGGLSGRLYAMLAQEMSDTSNRGRILWLLATSRPDLVEVDLKRPGRIDVKIPLLPTATVADSAALLAALCKRRGLALDAQTIADLGDLVPIGLTPGAAEAIAVKAYRRHRTDGSSALDALRDSLDGWQQPVPADVMDFQMRIAIREATDIDFVPEAWRHLVAHPQ